MNPSTAKKLLKMTNELYEEEAHNFSNTRKEVWEKEIIDFVSQIEPGSSVLDLGCGNGRLLQLLNTECKMQNLVLKTYKINNKCYSHVLQNMRIHYLGIDQSKKLIDVAREKYINLDKNIIQRDPSTSLRMTPKFMVGDGLIINFDRQFDYIICHAVLHHIPSEKLQLKFLKNIHRALKPYSHPRGGSGEVLISVWNRWQARYERYFQKNHADKQYVKYSDLIADMDYADLLTPWRQSGHFRYIHAFRPIELKNLAQRAGFKNIRVFASCHGIKTNLKKALNIYLMGEK